MQCYDYTLYISFFANKGRIGYLNILEHQHLYLVEIYIDSEHIM